jgi:hypothetical protein
MEYTAHLKAEIIALLRQYAIRHVTLGDFHAVPQDRFDLVDQQVIQNPNGEYQCASATWTRHILRYLQYSGLRFQSKEDVFKCPVPILHNVELTQNASCIMQELSRNVEVDITDMLHYYVTLLNWKSGDPVPPECFSSVVRDAHSTIRHLKNPYYRSKH